MDGSRLRLIAVVGAVAVVITALLILLVVLVTTSNFEAIAPVIIGFVTPTITTLLVYGTASLITKEKPNDDQHNN